MKFTIVNIHAWPGYVYKTFDYENSLDTQGIIANTAKTNTEEKRAVEQSRSIFNMASYAIFIDGVTVEGDWNPYASF